MDKKGIFIYGNKNIYEQTLKFYKCLVGKIPPKYSILLCNEETTLEELLAFLYLSLLCKFHSLFIILKPDKLKISLQIILQEKIESFENSQINSLIIILFSNIGESDIGKELLTIKFIKKIEEPKIILDIINEIEVVSSTLAGYGKSTYIEKGLKNEYQNKIEGDVVPSQYKYICFPLGGEVKRSIIMKRLNDLKLDSSCYYGLHLDLFQTH